MKFQSRSRDRGMGFDVLKNNGKRRRSKKPTGRGREALEDERMPSDEKCHRSGDEREEAPRNRSRSRHTQRGRDKKTKERHASPEKSKKPIRGRNRPRRNQTSPTRGRRVLQKEGRRPRSSSPRKRSGNEHRRRHRSVPSTRRRPRGTGEKKLRREKQGRREKQEKPPEDTKERSQDFEDMEGQAEELDRLLATQDYEAAFNRPRYELMLRNSSETPSIVEKRSKRRLEPSESMKTKSFEDAMADGCVANYDGVIYRVFDFIGANNTYDDESLRYEQEKARKEKAKKEKAKKEEPQNVRGGLLETLCVVDDASERQESVEIQYVDQQIDQQTTASTTTEKSHRFSWRDFFSEF